jgi:dTDP-glucose pyrophosphorylase
MSEIQGVILAAGKGRRIQPFSNKLPKPLLPVLDRPLLVWQIEALKKLGVRRIVIVIGHLGHCVVQALGDGRGQGVEIAYVEQEHMLGIAHAVAQLEPYVQAPFLLFLGDIFFVHDGLQGMVALLGQDEVKGVLAVKEEPSVEAIRRNFVVLEDARGFVTRVIEKPRHPRTRVKGCGLYLFDPVFFDAVRRTPRTALRDEYEITDAIQIFLDDGHRVRAARAVRDDLNLSYPRDLLDINLRLLGAGSLLGRDVQLHPGARVERSVLMDGARVEHPVAVRECLLFPGAVLPGTGDVERRIVTADHVIDCR